MTDDYAQRRQKKNFQILHVTKIWKFFFAALFRRFFTLHLPYPPLHTPPEFEILSTVDSDSGTRGCIIPERNDVQSLVNSNPSIKKVLFNGGKAYKKALDYGCLNVEMPSTSSANTHLTQEELFSIWVKEIKEK